MKNKILLILFLLQTFLLAQNFKFVAMSDSRGKNNGVNDSVLTEIVNHIITTQPEVKFIVFAGDLVTGTEHEPEVTYRQLLHWKEVMAPIYNNPKMIWPKVWPIIGNHEARHPKDEENFNKAFPNVYSNGPEDEKGISYSFDFNNAHFTFVNTDRWYYGDPNDTTDDRRDWHYIKHIDWLENDLKAATERGVKHIFVVSHEMIYPTGGHLHDGLANLGRKFKGVIDSTRAWYLDRRQKVIDILKKYKVDAHICGHEHTYARQKVNGVFEIIAGSAGAHLYYPNPTYRADADSHYVWEEMSYTAAIPYYKTLNYFYGPGENSQASRNFVTKRAFNYSVFDVHEDTVFVETYGAFPEKENSTAMGTKIHLIDKFLIKKD